MEVIDSWLIIFGYYDNIYLDSLVPSGFSYRDKQGIVRDVLEAFESYDYCCSWC
jgi:hypothetical protein